MATAIKGHAELIVTFNLKDFPAEVLKPWGIVATHPADYLITLYSIEPALMVAKLDDFAREKGISREQLLGKLNRSVPGFCRHVADGLSLTLPD